MGLQDNDIAAARHRLARYTQNLNAALSVTGRRNDIVVRTKLQNIEDRLRAISHINPTRSINSGIGTRPPDSRPVIQIPRRKARITVTQGQPRSSAKRNISKETCISTPIYHQNDSVITSRTATLDDPSTLSFNHAYPNISIYEQADRTLYLDSGNSALHQITKPVMLLRDLLIKCFETMRTNRVLSVSEPQVEQIQVLVDLLAASAHTASAENITKKYSKNSRVESLERNLVPIKYKDLAIKKRGINSSSIATSSLPIYLEENSMELDTIVGSVNAKVLSARSFVNSKTLPFLFRYYGHGELSLSPFTVDFMSHEFMSCFRCGSKNVCERCLLRSQRPSGNRGIGLGHIGLLDMVHSFLPSIISTIYGVAQPTDYVSQYVGQWGNDEITIYMSCAWNLPRIVTLELWSDINQQFERVEQVFKWKYHRRYYPLRDAEFAWDSEIGFGDPMSTVFVRGVASLVAHMLIIADYLREPENGSIPVTTGPVKSSLLSY